MVQSAAAKSLQSCLTLCDPRDGSPPGSPVPGILQARTLEWVAISFSKYINKNNQVILNLFIFTQRPSNAQQAVYSCRTRDIATVKFRLGEEFLFFSVLLRTTRNISLFLASSLSHSPWFSQRCLSRSTKLLQRVVNSALLFQGASLSQLLLFQSSPIPMSRRAQTST